MTLSPVSQMRTLGLIGGTSWHSTVEYYRYINQFVNELYGNNTNPPLLLYNLNQQEIHKLQLEDRWEVIANVLSDAATKLQMAGAQAILFCANTPHKMYGEVSKKTRIPILHIFDAAGLAIQQAGLEKIGLIGTLYTMEDGFVQRWLGENYRVEVVVPSSSEARRELHRIIHEELGLGVFKQKTKRYVLEQISELRKQGAQGIILGCTEFPLIIHESDLQLPCFDTTRLHSQMAVDYLMGRYEPREPEK